MKSPKKLMPLTVQGVLISLTLFPPGLLCKIRPPASYPSPFSGVSRAALLVLYQSKPQSVCLSPYMSSHASRCGDWQLNSWFSKTKFSSVSVSLFLLLPVPFSLLAFSILIRLLFGVFTFFLQLIIFPTSVLHDNLFTSPSRLYQPTGDTHLFRGGRNPPCY